MCQAHSASFQFRKVNSSQVLVHVPSTQNILFMTPYKTKTVSLLLIRTLTTLRSLLFSVTIGAPCSILPHRFSQLVVYLLIAVFSHYTVNSQKGKTHLSHTPTYSLSLVQEPVDGRFSGTTCLIYHSISQILNQSWMFTEWMCEVIHQNLVLERRALTTLPSINHTSIGVSMPKGNRLAP